jgi:iron uptake system EfeUOB component EfeO/EfeM
MRRTTIVVVLAVLALAVSACGSSSKAADPGVKTVEISLTDAGCDPAHIETAAGPTSFKVTNDGADAVSEFEVLDAGGKILGEKENLTPGLSGDFSITLKPGTYVTACPGGKTAAQGELVVNGRATTDASVAGLHRHRTGARAVRAG